MRPRISTRTRAGRLGRKWPDGPGSRQAISPRGCQECPRGDRRAAATGCRLRPAPLPGTSVRARCRGVLQPHPGANKDTALAPNSGLPGKFVARVWLSSGGPASPRRRGPVSPSRDRAAVGRHGRASGTIPRSCRGRELHRIRIPPPCSPARQKRRARDDADCLSCDRVHRGPTWKNVAGPSSLRLGISALPSHRKVSRSVRRRGPANPNAGDTSPTDPATSERASEGQTTRPRAQEPQYLPRTRACSLRALPVTGTKPRESHEDRRNR